MILKHILLLSVRMKNDTTLNEKIASISEALRRISEHISTDQWDHTLEYYEGDGTEEL